MKLVAFSGFKGGTGKTTLSINYCRYLYYYEHAQVCLLHFDQHQILSSLSKLHNTPYPVRSILLNDFSEESIEELTGHNFLILDCPSVFSVPYLSLLKFMDLLIVPFFYSVLDYYKLLAFSQVLKKLEVPPQKVRLLPNHFTEKSTRTSQAKSLIREAPFLQQLEILPGIPRNKPMTELQMGPLHPSELNNIRPAFIKIINNLV